MSFRKVLIAAGIFAASASAQAIPTLDVMTGNPGFAGISDSGAEYVTLNDTDGSSDSSVASMIFEYAGYESSFGIYSFTDDGLGNVSVTDTLEVFNGAVEPGPWASQAIFFDLGSNTAWVDGLGGTAGVLDASDTSANIGSKFGFYLDIPTSDIWYSHTSLNSDGFDHLGIFATPSYNTGVVLAWEDLKNGGDKDYNDMVIGVSDVTVPEPSTIALLGLGLAGLGLARRRVK